MKFSKKTEDTFKPVTINIVAESIQELEILEAIGSRDVSISETLFHNHNFMYSTQDDAKQMAVVFCKNLKKIVGEL